MRIVFLGSGAFGLPTLEALGRAHDVALVVSQPDRPSGRGRKPVPTPVARWAQERGLPLIKPARVNEPGVVLAIRDARADANVVVAFGQRIGDGVVCSPRLGRAATINLHASLLPKYRGAAPIHWAVMSGETVTGNTVFSLVDRMDAGDILGSQPLSITPSDTTGDLHDKLAAMGPDLVLDVLTRLHEGRATAQPQDETQATLAPKLGRRDAVVDFAASAEEIRRRVHGLSPWPGVEVYYTRPGETERHSLKLLRVQAAGDQEVAASGGIYNGLSVACGEGRLCPVRVQPPGKRPMSWDDFLRGHPLPQGTRFSGKPDAA